ncbi:error-prone DNA polymerase [Opitutales bacterium ASA1]|uniref:DNA polymerase III subunit alpha n=1 Tax=Congregicoccus parvus TaxID=3081749 RepID=UPI002B30419A|nr:error-prone DNA polymerase [Opitutales bacterium ASA1]
MSGYVELHARSAFSFLRGASSPEDLVAAATRFELPAVALCDRDGVYGAPRFFNAARQTGVRALVGAEITLQDGSVLPLLVSSLVGYRNLCRLITETKLRPVAGGPDPDTDPSASAPSTGRKRPCFATWLELARFSEGLVALTGDEDGPVRRAWVRDGESAAEDALQTLVDVFGHDRVHVEVQRRMTRGEEHGVQMLRRLAAAHDLPLLATGGVDYATAEAREIADVFTCLRHHTTLDAAGRLLAPNAGRRLRDARAMYDLFRDMPEAVQHSVRLAEQLEFTLKDLGYRFPDFDVPPGETQASWLRKQAFAGAAERCKAGLAPQVRAQLEKELTLIEKLGFCGYFLVVWDICAWCRRRGILVQGRGSAANSLVCYALGITAADPLECRLLFERFLSEGRIGADGHPSWPDIDLDLPSGDLRESVIQEIYARYGPRGAGMTANVITYRGRSSARELGKVLDLPENILDTFSSLFANGDFPHTLDLRKQMAMAGLPANHPRIDAFARLYCGIRSLPRHLGQHSGGMVICAGALDGVVPLEPAAMPGRVVVQWDKDDCEELGIVKVDFLGLGMMAVLQDTFALSSARGRPCEMHTIPQDDAETFAAMQAADTVGVFQIESRAQMSTLKRFKPATFYDVAIQVAIVRPGPIVGKVAHPMLRRRAKLEPIVCLDPSVHDLLKPVLERTYGVILFQEQMLQIAMLLACFTATEAEELRRAMGFTKGTERLARVLKKLRESMRARGHGEHVIEQVIDSATSFALYGFPEAHAVSFGLLAYVSTWLNVHRAPEFLASLLDNQPMGFYSPATLVQDARRHGLRVRPPDVTVSDWRCTVEDDHTVRLGLHQVRGVREDDARHMLAARAERPFSSMDDFLARTRFSRAERRALASVGAFAALAPHRRAALWCVEEDRPEDDLFTLAARKERERESAETRNQFSTTPASVPAIDSPLAAMNRLERVQADYAGMALTTGVHPMKLVRDRLPDVVPAAELALHRDGERVTIAGAVICRQRPGTAKGFVFISLEDETGVANAIVVPDLFEQRRLVITQEPFLRITGRLQIDAGVIHVKAARIVPLVEHALPAEASHDFH